MATKKQVITLPYNFVPRDYQLPLFQALDSGIKRAIIVWARRHGKDCVCFNILLKKAIEKKGVYYLIFPTYSQARRAFWDSITEDGISYLDFCPKEIIARRLNHEMKLFLINGSIIQIVGSDDPNAIRGTNPIGIVLSEFAYQNPTIWTAILDPILQKNQGWAIFNSTPQGKNYFYDLYKYAEANPEEWFSQIITVKETGLLTEDEIEKKVNQGISRDLLDQEYYCLFDIGIQGAYYGKSIKEAQDSGRICHVPYDKNLLVYTAWDLGFTDAMAIIFFQKRGNEILIIDHYENQSFALSHYLDVLRERKYSYGIHYIPHDGKQHSSATGTSFISVANQSEFHFSVLEDKRSVMDGVEHVRGIFPRIFFDQEKCSYLIKCLLQYHAEWDDNAKVFRGRPKHDWSSHTADAFRYLAIAIDLIGNTPSGMSLDRLKEMKRRHGLD